MRLAALALAIVGCGAPIDWSRVVDPPEGAAEATRIILREYNASGAGMPPVYWYRPSDGDCPGVMVGSVCADGYHHEHIPGFESERIVVIRWPGLEMHKCALAHEIAHWRYDADVGHPAYVFGADYSDSIGIDGGKVGATEAVLAAAGL